MPIQQKLTPPVLLFTDFGGILDNFLSVRAFFGLFLKKYRNFDFLVQFSGMEQPNLHCIPFCRNFKLFHENVKIFSEFSQFDFGLL